MGLEFLLKLRNSIKNVKTNVKYLPLDERIPYSVIDMKSEELTPCVKTEQKKCEYKGIMQTKNSISICINLTGSG